MIPAIPLGSASALVSVMVQLSRVCPVIRSSVTLVIDDDRDSVSVVCPYHQRDGHACRLRSRTTSGGPLSDLLTHRGGGHHASADERCVLDAVGSVAGAVEQA